MDHPKPAFDVNDEAYIILTPVGCINAMFSHTDGEGRLRLPAWPNDTDDINEVNSIIRLRVFFFHSPYHVRL